MTLEQLREKIMEALSEQYNEDLVSLWNEYTDYNNDPDSRIYSMYDFDDLLNGIDPFDIARMAIYGDFNPSHDWFWFNGYGNLDSSDYPSDKVDMDEIADMIVDTMDSYGNSDIQALIDEYEDQEEEVE